MSKAFDCLRYSVLFKKLLEAGIPAIFLIMVIYTDQFANVKWNGVYSTIFHVSNEAVSVLQYCIAFLFEKLRLSGFGCWINGNYHEIFEYLDDNLLLLPSLQEFAMEH